MRFHIIIPLFFFLNFEQCTFNGTVSPIIAVCFKALYVSPVLTVTITNSQSLQPFKCHHNNAAINDPDILRANGFPLEMAMS